MLNNSASNYPELSVFSVEHEDKIAVVSLNRPEKRNALGQAFFDELPAAMQQAQENGARAVVLAANGPSFTVGLDLKEMGSTLSTGGGSEGSAKRSQAASNLALKKRIKYLQDSITSVEECAVPVIAAVHGYCIGGGIDLITAADFRVASQDAIFTVRETKIAIVADLGTLQRLPRIIPAGHAAELVYTGRDFGADHALSIGLVNSIHQNREATIDAAKALAKEIASNSPITVYGAREVMRASMGLTVGQGLDHVALWNSAFLASNDLVEAVTAFIEKRDANFDGS